MGLLAFPHCGLEKKWPCHGDVAVSSPQYAGNTSFFSNFLFSPVFSLAGFVAEAFSCAFRWDFKNKNVSYGTALKQGISHFL